MTSVVSSPSIAVPTTVTARNDTSPGELARNISVLPAPPEDERSLGEVNNPQVVNKTSRSPGEVPPILRASETRHGIDVIRISKWSEKLPSNNNGQTSAMTSESQYLMEQFDSSEIIQVSSRSSMNTQDNTPQHVPMTSHTSADDEGSTQQSSKLTKPHMLHMAGKAVTINIPDATGGFSSEESSNKEHSSPMTLSISETITSSSENF